MIFSAEPDEEIDVSDDAISIALDSNAGSELLIDQEEPFDPETMAEEREELTGKQHVFSREEIDLEKDFCNEVYAIINRLKAVIRGGGEKSDQLTSLKDLLRLFTITGDSKYAPSPHRRVGERILLDPNVNLADTILIPLYQSHYDDIIEHCILLSQKLTEMPHSHFTTIYPPSELQRYLTQLSRFKEQLLAEPHSIFAVWKAASVVIRRDLERDGLTVPLLQRKNQIKARLGLIKLDRDYQLTAQDIELGLANGSAGDKQGGAAWHTNGQKRLDEIEALRKSRRNTISRVLVALKQLIINLMSISSNSLKTQKEPELQQTCAGELGFISSLFHWDLHELFSYEWQVILNEEAYLREKRKPERRDEYNNILGSDEVLLWRNLEFQYQLCRYISPIALSTITVSKFMNPKQETVNHADELGAGVVKIRQYTLDLAGSLMRQHVRAPVNVWDKAGDRKRFHRLVNVLHRESTKEKVESGEIRYGAVDTFHLLAENWAGGVTAPWLVKYSNTFWASWSAQALSSLSSYVMDYVSQALDKLWNTWVKDVDQQTVEFDITSSTICRIINVLAWTMIYTYAVTAQLVEIPTGDSKVEERLATMAYWSRCGFTSKTIQFLNQRLARELRLAAKDRSHALLRCTTRLMVLQNAWAKLLYQASEKGSSLQRASLREVGKCLYINIAKNQSTALIVRLLQNYTTSNAELELLLYTLLSIDQLEFAAQEINSVAEKTRKKVFARRGSKFVDTGVDEKEMAEAGERQQRIGRLFRGVICIPKTITKLLFLASKADLFPLAIRRAVFNLLDCLGASDTGKVIAWDLQRLEILNNILISEEPLAENVKSLIMESIKLLADTASSNKFMVCEVLFSSLLMEKQYRLRELLTNYQLMDGIGTKATSQGTWNMAQTRALMNAYEKAKHAGGRGVLRQLRIDIDSEELEDAIRRYNLVDCVYLGDNSSSSFVRDMAITHWILTEEDQQLSDDGITIHKVVPYQKDPTFGELLTKIRGCLSRNGNKLDDLCVGMIITTIITEVLRWETDQRYEGEKSEPGSVQGYIKAVTVRKVMRSSLCQRYLSSLCSLRKHHILPSTVSPSLEPNPGQFEKPDFIPTWIANATNLILLLIGCNPLTGEPFLQVPLATLEMRNHLTKMAVSRPLSELEEKVESIQKNQQAALSVKASEAIRVIQRTRNVISELGAYLSDITALVTKLIVSLELYCASKDITWDRYMLVDQGEEEEELCDFQDFQPKLDPWSEKENWNMANLVDGLEIPNLLHYTDDSKQNSAPLGPLGSSLSYQAFLYSLGGTSNTVVNPSEWEWSTARITKPKLAKLLLIARFALRLDNDEMAQCVTHKLESCQSELEIWKLLTSPLASEEIDESVFTNESIYYKFTKTKKKTAERPPATAVTEQPAPASECPVKPLPKKKLLIKKASRKEKDKPADDGAVEIPLALEDGSLSDEEGTETFEQAQLRLAEQWDHMGPVVEKPLYRVDERMAEELDTLVWNIDKDDLDLFGGVCELLDDL